jgi:general nucleoside transport system permease protein
MSVSQLLGPEVLHATVLLAAPFLLAAFGELIIERAGVLNLAIEGQMTVAASAAFVVAFALHKDSAFLLYGLGAGLLTGVAVGLALAFLCVVRRADQIPVGIGLLILGLGLAAFVYRASIGIRTSPPTVPILADHSIPLLSAIPGVGRVLFDQPYYVYAALLAVVPLHWILFHTPIGLRLRATGENPRSIDRLGLPVTRIRVLSVVAGGALIGLGGAFFPLALAGGYTDAIISGRGWLALLLVILGGWRPLNIFGGAFLFAYLYSLQFQLAVTAHAIPVQLLEMLPYVLAVVVIGIVYGRTVPPAALGLPYERESRL